jgi:hypothetical protein
LLQPSEITDTRSGYTLLDNKLNWTSGNNNGNLPGHSPSYNYDTLNRLTSTTETSNGTTTWAQGFGYDRYADM